MVARIYPPSPIKRSLNYNENKVKAGKAECLLAENFLLEKNQMNFYQKLTRFEQLAALNQRTDKSGLHISLNFDPSENIGKEKLIAIAAEYMEKTGFGDQPYLVYKHMDAGHPHLHVLTSLIKEDGKRIDIHNLGRNASEKARKTIEIKFGLLKAEGRNQGQNLGIEPVNVSRVQYGKSETKRSITNVLDAVLTQYKYTSLAELNAVLRQYNIIADRGPESGRIYKYGGLLFKILDDQGNKIGVPIKASSIYSRPTLKNLEQRFAENEERRLLDRQKLKSSVEWVLSNGPKDLDDFIRRLQKEKIQTVLRQNKEGLLYGITFIDYRTKSVFNGSDLGRSYSLSNIMKRLGERPTKEKTGLLRPVSKALKQELGQGREIRGKMDDEQNQNSSLNKDDLMQMLLKSERNDARLPYQLLQKKRRKKPKLGL